jgi:hypothetical protein
MPGKEPVNRLLEDGVEVVRRGREKGVRDVLVDAW